MAQYSTNQLEKFLGRWRSAKRKTMTYPMILQEMLENWAYTRDLAYRAACHRKRKFLSKLRSVSIEGAALSTESAPFYRMAGFLGIPIPSAFYRKRKFLESAEHIYMHLYKYIMKINTYMHDNKFIAQSGLLPK